MATSRVNFTFTRILQRIALKEATDLSQDYAMTTTIMMITTMVKLISIVKKIRYCRGAQISGARPPLRMARNT
jgi:hypothetical protein